MLHAFSLALAPYVALYGAKRSHRPFPQVQSAHGYWALAWVDTIHLQQRHSTHRGLTFIALESMDRYERTSVLGLDVVVPSSLRSLKPRRSIRRCLFVLFVNVLC